MKKIVSAISSLVLALSLCSCGDTSKVDNLISSSDSDNNTSLSWDVTKSSKSENSSQNEEYDVDLTVLDASMMYAQVYDMLNNPDNYNGKTVRAKGSFSYYKDPQTNNEYFAVLVSDITACCAQGIEFRLDGDYSYPEDYPPLETEITITGVCDIYKEGSATYMQLLNAEYTAN